MLLFVCGVGGSGLPVFAQAQTAHQNVQAQYITVTGTVYGSDGEPLIGASVMDKANKIGVTTDIDGRFSLKLPQGATLTVTYVGMDPQEIKAVTTPMEITLKENSEILEEVVVVGYGTMRKKDLTGSVTQIKPDKIAAESPKTVQDILRGTPGLRIGLSTSAKGGGSINIRGTRSVSGTSTSDPLLILDGVPFYGELSEINPQDIGQIDILKDASAAAVYGAKAANGVIIITTKKGSIGKPMISFRANFGFDTKGNYPEVFDDDGYMQYREDWYKTPTYGFDDSGVYGAYNARDSKGNLSVPRGYYDRPDRLPSGVSIEQWRVMSPKVLVDGESDLSAYARRLDLDDVVLDNYIAGRSFDWYNHCFRTGFNQDYNLSISGANDRINYYLGGGYSHNESAIRGDYYRAIRVNMKLGAKITKWLEVTANANFQDRSDDSDGINVGSAVENSPYADYKDKDGNLALHPMGDKTPYFRGYNYDYDLQYKKYEKGYQVLNSIFTAKVTLPFNITYSFNISPRFQYYYNRYFSSADHPDRTPLSSGVDRNWGKHFDWNLNNTINWDYTFARKHRVNVTLVQEAEEFRSWSDNIYSRNILPSDALGFHNTQNGEKEASSFSTNDTHQSANGLMGRLFYGFDDRYMLTATIRRDGYSAFGTNYPYATFPSFAIAWNFKNEKFLEHITWMNMGKLRLSWGKNGNRSLSDPYISLSNLRNGTGLYGYLDNSGKLTEHQYVLVDRLASPNLQWEKSEALNGGIDFGFLNNAISGSIDLYNIRTTNMILAKQLPDFTGFQSIATNLGEVVNRGIEITLNTRNINTENFVWTTDFNFSYNSNKIKHLYYEYEDVLDKEGNVVGVKERDEYGKWFIGKDISTIWDYKTIGIWQVNEAEEAARYGQTPGDPKVANIYTEDDIVNADGTITPVYNDKDKVFLGKTTSPIHWQMRNSFTIFKNISFSFNLYSYMGAKYLDTSYLNQDNGANVVTYGANRCAKEYWTPENPSNTYARLNAKTPNGAGAPRVLSKDFIRLENISLSYSFPKKLSDRLSIQALNVYGSIRNVAVWSKDKRPSGDPETGGYLNRIYTIGLNVTF